MSLTTCLLSGLPIHDGDKVVLFLLEPKCINEASTKHIYPEDLWIPAFVPIFAVAEDFGGITDVAPGSEAVVDFFRDQLSGKNAFRLKPHRMQQYQEPGYYDRLPETVEDLINNFLNDDGGRIVFGNNDLPVACCQMHERVYLEQIELIGSRRPDGKTETLGQLLMERQLAAMQPVPSLQARCSFSINGVEATGAELEKIMQQFGIVGQETQADAQGSELRIRSPFLGSRSKLNFELFDYLETSRVQDTATLARHLVNYQLMNQVMEFLRTLWQPGYLSGSIEYVMKQKLLQTSLELISGHSTAGAGQADETLYSY